jgi:hypothetical protein
MNSIHPLQQTGHAISARARHNSGSRVSRLLSWVFGPWREPRLVVLVSSLGDTIAFSVEIAFMRTLTSWDSLQPLVGTTSESADLDFKETLNPEDPKSKIEFAKDVAALANVLGGHVLVGASTDMGNTRCKGFHGIDIDRAGKISSAFEERVKHRCRPTPIFNVRSINLPNDSKKVVVVVMVEASPIAPIGVLLDQDGGGALSIRVGPSRTGSAH